MQHRRQPPDVQKLAAAAHADVASLATSLSLLAESRHILLEAEQAEITAGIRSKCMCAIMALRVIVETKGGVQ